MATLTANAAAVKSAATAIDAAIVAKGGTTEGGLRNAAAAIAALPSGEGIGWDGETFEMHFNFEKFPWAGRTVKIRGVENACKISWGDGSETTYSGWTDRPSHTYADNVNFAKLVITITSGTLAFMYAPLEVANEALVEMRIPTWLTSDTTRPWATDILMPHTILRFPTLPIRISLGNWAAYRVAGHPIINNQYLVCSTYSDTAKFFGADITIGENCASIGSGVNGSMHLSNVSVIKSLRNTFTIGANAFRGSSTLRKFEGLAKLIITNAQQCFQGCAALRELPDELDFTTCTANGDRTFASCTALRKLPSQVTTNVSLTFAPCTGVTDKESVQSFVDNLNTCANDGKTITLNSQIKALFDADEQAAIEATMAAKNWTLAW